MRAGLALLAVFLLGGCATTTLPPAPEGPAQQAYEKDYFHVDIPTHDGMNLKATVYQPELAAGETAPVIIATHGFGIHRAERPWSFHGKMMITGKAALKAWRKGYWVVYYDQRGWGDSDGVVHMMDPEFEVRDVSSVIDWTLKHIPAVHKLPDGQPALGMIGESYGGGAQTMAAFQDDRLHALVPIATWHDLNGLAPNGHMRTNWGAHLFSIGSFTSGFDIGFMVKKPFRSGFLGSLDHEAQQIMYQHSPAFYCDQGRYPKADALFVQGFRDTIFPLQDAWKNAECFEAGGNDARVLGIQGGHILPWPVQRYSGKPLFNTDDEVTCGAEAEPKPLDDMILAWWDEKLLGAEGSVPDLCLTLNYESGNLFDQFPEGGETFMLPDSWVHLPLAGMFEWLMVPFDVGGDIFRRALWPGSDFRMKEPVGGFGRPKFMPLYIAHEDERLLGVPEIDVYVDSIASKVKAVPFVGIGVQEAGMRRVKVVSEQLTPLPGKGRYAQELPAVARRLKEGDRVGLVIYGYTWQFFTNPSLWHNKARLRGDVTLPILQPEAEK
jgi:ABC-2 type transport system ATP-binding protein